MSGQLQIKFDPNQDYQVEAVNSVVALFDGLPQHSTDFQLGDEIVPNLPSHEALAEDWLFDNLRAVQGDNGLPISSLLAVDDGLQLQGASDDSWRYPSFTIEMETGTGKTYVYLRTIYELHKTYGFSKFIIVVPSVAIYEGVVKNFEITRAHFRALYSNATVNLTRYEGSQISRLRSFATSTFAEILVMTLDSFNKAGGKSSNLFYRSSEKLPGERLPYEFVQQTRPIVILDEPQNMESDRAREALRTLNPLFALRYSATHRTSPNLVYRLTPFDAYRRNLVKKIQVIGITERDSSNQDFLTLQSITGTGKNIRATVRTRVTQKGQTREADIELKQGDNLFKKTGRDEHFGYQVAEINVKQSMLAFSNGQSYTLRDSHPLSRVDLFRTQIENTIQQHIERQARLRDEGVKVLSLFFIDRVANYTADEGIIRRLFDEAFEKYKGRDPHLADLRPDQVREAYFARSKTKKSGEGGEAIDTEGRNQNEREAEKAAFELIMRDKERLLSFDEPVCFIFAHSALKEGWDNPNVFQICTLNQTVSEMKKRQEIGRGLRLCVNQDGERIFGDVVNILTVIANERYQDYAATLQSEYTEDGQEAPPQPTDALRKPAQRNNAIFRDEPEFQKFWEKLARRLTYHIHVDTDALIEECVERLNNQTFPDPRVVIERGSFSMTRYTLILEKVSGNQARITVRKTDTDDNTETSTRSYKRNDDLSRLINDESLRSFVITEIDEVHSCVRFGEFELYLDTPCHFQTQSGQRISERATVGASQTYPVFNLLDRTARETGLTRPTINAIFKRMREQKQGNLFRNPEGFAAVFVTEIRNALANHVAERIRFTLADTTPYDLDMLFPERKEFPQRELLEADEHGLYDQVQIDSGVETNFVTNYLKGDDKVLFYFKFPPAFKIGLPAIIGNYNPDWGIARYDDEGKIVLHLVRETKGTTDIQNLQFSHEKRKIICARKHFLALDIDYRVVSDKTADWWSSEELTQGTL